jgi:hypothetical protein
MSAVRNRVTTATLVRGKVYVFKGLNQEKAVHYKRGIPLVVAADLADELEELVEEIHDSEGEIFDKPYFAIHRDIEEPEPEVKAERQRRRLAPPANTTSTGSKTGIRARPGRPG